MFLLWLAVELGVLRAFFLFVVVVLNDEYDDDGTDNDFMIDCVFRWESLAFPNPLFSSCFFHLLSFLSHVSLCLC